MDDLINYLIGFRDGVDGAIEKIIETLTTSDVVTNADEETKEQLIGEVLKGLNKILKEE